MNRRECRILRQIDPILGQTRAVDSRVLKTHPPTDFPAFAAYLSADQAGSVNSFISIHNNTKIFDTHAAFNTATYSFVVPAGLGGIYSFSAYVRLSRTGGTAFSNFVISIMKNTVETVRGSEGADSSTVAARNLSCLIQCVPGDIITPYI